MLFLPFIKKKKVLISCNPWNSLNINLFYNLWWDSKWRCSGSGKALMNLRHPFPNKQYGKGGRAQKPQNQLVLSSDSILYSITLSMLFYYLFLKPRIQQMGSGGSELHSPSLPGAFHPPIELLYESNNTQIGTRENKSVLCSQICDCSLLFI